MLPQSLESATARMMRPNSIAREESVFGEDFVEHFGGTRQHEVRLWNEAVTNWEGQSLISCSTHMLMSAYTRFQWNGIWSLLSFGPV